MYRVKDWDRYYENHETRKLHNLKFVLIPNKHDGAGFRRIAERKDCCEVFAAWILLLEIASKSEKRGNLPALPEDAGYKTGFPAKIFKNAYSVLSSPEIGWIEEFGEKTAFLPESPGVAGESPAIDRNFGPELNRTEGNRTEGNRIIHARPTIHDVRKYCAERMNEVDPEAWFSYYESNGWRVGKNPMKNWKAAIVTWEKNGIGRKKKSFGPSEFTEKDLREQAAILGVNND